MDLHIGAGAGQEILVVLALAAAGLMLAALAAFTPWYGPVADQHRPAVVELQSPGWPAGPP
jgi:hypothetical protein